MATLCLPSSSSSVKLAEISSSIHSFPANPNLLRSSPRRRRPLFDHFLAVNYVAESFKWRAKVSFFPFFSTKTQDTESLKLELLEAIAPLDRGAEATPEDQKLVDQAGHIASKLEAANKVKEPLKSSLLNGKWELLYTTSQSILQTKVSDKALVRLLLWQRPKFLRANGKIYQAINTDTLRAQNIETWPFFNQASADLIPLNARRVAVKFDSFKIAGLIPIKNRGSGRGQLEITYLDEELRISRGNQGNLFILRMVDPSYRVPL
ncbi:putative plastid-lipid-associated protein 4, chloroplastic [Capsicum annuum]|nr:putative plastid-lipid-associated protein 4, chloroplastic [Capsicum annuum]KAF3660979.1 putative plastid-lipid-associated protein 4, chloroplastic [Capsicum annuum]